jgi:hypothetical protein
VLVAHQAEPWERDEVAAHLRALGQSKPTAPRWQILKKSLFQTYVSQDGTVIGTEVESGKVKKLLLSLASVRISQLERLLLADRQSQTAGTANDFLRDYSYLR